MNDLQAIANVVSTVGLPGLIALISLNMLRDRTRRNGEAKAVPPPCSKHDSRITVLETSVPLHQRAMSEALDSLRCDMNERFNHLQHTIDNMPRRDA